MNLNELTIREAKEGLKNKKFSSVELTKACLSRIKQVEPVVNAFITVCEKEATEKAKKADEIIRNQESGIRNENRPSFSDCL